MLLTASGYWVAGAAEAGAEDQGGGSDPDAAGPAQGERCRLLRVCRWFADLAAADCQAQGRDRVSHRFVMLGPCAGG